MINIQRQIHSTTKATNLGWGCSLEVTQEVLLLFPLCQHGVNAALATLLPKTGNEVNESRGWKPKQGAKRG